jgi:hypothetical protein
MLLDTREKDAKQAKEGFSPSVVNTARAATISSGAKVGF